MPIEKSRVDETELRQRTTAFYDKYLWRPAWCSDHRTLVLFDRQPPTWFRAALNELTRTTVEFVEITAESAFTAVILERRGRGRYVSVHDFITTCFPSPDQRPLDLLNGAEDLDYTSFELPRFGLTDAQFADQLGRFVAGDLDRQRDITDHFFGLLGTTVPYRIDILSGEHREHRLTITGCDPWMELTGPLCSGNVRFAPGAELFSRGQGASGVLKCTGGLNILPLRSQTPEIAFCDALLEIASRIATDPLLLRIDRGRIVDVFSDGDLADCLMSLLAADPAFSTVVEVGIGVSSAARPIVNSWPAASNEAVPGVHVGVGADPSDTRRFRTTIHFDFVCEEVSIQVNGYPFFQDGNFLCGTHEPIHLA